MKPTAEDERVAREIVEAECGKRGLTPLEAQMNLDNLENRIASALAAEREKAAKIADGEREKSAALWERAANLPVKDTSAMKVYNGRQLAAGDIARTIRAGDKE